MKKKFALCIVCVIASVVSGCLLMFAIYALPTAPMKEHAFAIPDDGDVLLIKGEYGHIGGAIAARKWKRNFVVLVEGKPLLLIFSALLIYTIYTLVRRRRSLKQPTVLLLGLSSLMPLLWYAVLKHHVIIHSWITFRIYVISCFAILCIVCELRKSCPRR